MANVSLFKSHTERTAELSMTINKAGGKAYKYTAEEIVAQLSVTGTLSDTFYSKAEEQFNALMDALKEVDPEYIAKTAVYARHNGKMKDTPALLVAYLSVVDNDLFARVFHKVIDSGRMLRTFVQIMRSGQVGRKSLGTRPKRMVREWLEDAGIRQLMETATGNNPSLADIVKMVHPKPMDETRKAFYGWLIDKPYDMIHLPEEIRSFELWKKDQTLPLPNVPFRWLTSFELTTDQWTTISSRMGWQALRQNLNTLSRNGVFTSSESCDRIIKKLTNPESVAKAKVLPYQLMVAMLNVDGGVPLKVQAALEEVLEDSIANVPKMTGTVVVCPDVSGSMRSAITGVRKGATSKVRCIDVAGLMTASLCRYNPDAILLPFAEGVVNLELSRNDTVMTNAKKLASIGGGGTNISAPLALLNHHNVHVDVVVFVSDNESWMDTRIRTWGVMTEAMCQWDIIKKRCPNAKLICIDIQPYTTTQTKTRSDILNIGGFSDDVYDQMAKFISGEQVNWVSAINDIKL